MTSTFKSLAVITAAALVTCTLACKSSRTPTTKPSSPPTTEIKHPVPLVSRLVSSASKVREMPNGAQEVTVRLTLIVSNTTSRTYTGEAPDAALARFALTFNDEPLWSYPDSAAAIVTPVTLGPGGQLTYSAKLTIPDVRTYKGKVLSARATFVPAGLESRTEIPVQ